MALKIGYQGLTGYDSTAYVDAELDNEGNVLIDVPFSGTNKHTDEPLKVKWTGIDWVEVEK